MTIKAYVIALRGDEVVNKAVQRLNDSAPSNAIMHNFDAVVPKRVSVLSRTYNLEWNYPWSGQEMDIKSGLIKSAYPTKEPKRRIACFFSHYLLWLRCIAMEEPIIIHEHDACYFNDDPLPLEAMAASPYTIIGLNDPRKATRLSGSYHTKVQEQPLDICRAPEIDQPMVPQGIAGNSSYYIEPKGADKMIGLTKEFGAWPNDALMCRQLVPKLGQTKKYYTYVQGIQSTTSL